MKGRNDTTTAKADTSHFENPADAEAAKQVANSLAAGEDPFGDNDNDDGTPMVAAPAPAQASEEVDGALDDAGDAAAGEATAAADADAAAQAAEAARQAANTATQQATPAPAPAPAPAPQFKTKSAKELGDAQTALLDEKADAFDKYSSGTITATEYSAVDTRVMQGLMSIASENALAHPPACPHRPCAGRRS